MTLASAVAVSPYRVLDGDAAGIDPRAAAIGAWRGSLGDDEAQLGQRYDALCLHAPGGRPVLRFIEHADDGIIGFLALAPRRMRADDRELCAGVLSHLAIRPEHRSLGPALMLLESVLAAAEGRFDLVYGIPNASQGAVAALRRAGMRPMADMERSVRVVRHKHYLARRLPRLLAAPGGLVLDAADGIRRAWSRSRNQRLRARWADAFEPAMAGPWRSASGHPALTAVRDEAMLRWRFDAGVGMHIRYLVLEDAAGRVQAWFACGSEAQWPHLLEVHDFWSANACEGIPAAALDELLAAARARGHAAVGLRAAMGTAAAAPWIDAGFQRRGGQQVVVRWLDPTLAAAPPALHLTYIDQDG